MFEKRNGFLFAIFLVAASAARAGVYDASTSSYIGDSSSTEDVRGAVIQSDGTIVLAANIATAAPGNVAPLLLNGATGATGGAIIRLSGDGRTVKSVTRLGALVLGLSEDASDNLYVAAAYDGVFKLNPAASSILYQQLSGNYVFRVSAGSAGTMACHVAGSPSTADDSAGPGSTYVFDSSGNQLGTFGGLNNTQDIAVDENDQSIIQIGYRTASAYGPPSEPCNYLPVEISYYRALSYTGTVKYTGYDWDSSTSYNKTTNSYDPAANDCDSGVTDLAKIGAGFLNRYTNNMADTRGYRCSMGRDGYLYMAFESAGGNTIFLYDPFDLSVAAPIAGGDKYQNFSNTKSEHKTFFGRFNPATGAIIKGQLFTARLPSGAGNTLRVKNGAIEADENGNVYLGGASAYGLPIPPAYFPNSGQVAFNPLDPTFYIGGAYMAVFSPDLGTREFVTRYSDSGNTEAIAVRTLAGQADPTIVYAGLTNLSDPIYVVNPIQPSPGYGSQDAFYAVLGGSAATTNTSAFMLNFGGQQYCASQMPRDNTEAVHTTLDLQNAGVADDSQLEYPYSDSVPFSPTTGYTGPAIYGGMGIDTLNDPNVIYWGDQLFVGGDGSADQIRFRQNGGESHRSYGVLYVKKQDFPGADMTRNLVFKQGGFIQAGFDSGRCTLPIRWIVCDGTNWYVSQAVFTPSTSNGVASTSFSYDSDDGQWAPITIDSSMGCTAANLHFDDRNFTNITAVGLIIDQEAYDTNFVGFSLQQLNVQMAYASPDDMPPVSSFTASPVLGSVPLSTYLDGSPSAALDGYLTFYSWNFGDGTTYSGPNATHAYLACGQFYPTLRVFDNAGESGTSPPGAITVTSRLGAPPASTIAAWGGSTLTGTSVANRYVTTGTTNISGTAGAISGAAFSDTQPIMSGILGTRIYGGYEVETTGTGNAGWGSYGVISDNTAWNELSFQNVANSQRMHAVLFIDKSDFLNGASGPTVTVNGSSTFKAHFTYSNGNLGSVHWLVRDGSTYYVSQATFTPVTNGTSVLTFPGAADNGSWAVYSPAATNNMDFDEADAMYSTHQFASITAIGLMMNKDAVDNNWPSWEIADMEFAGAIVTGSPPSVALSTPTPGSSFNLGSNVTISATASEPGGSISEVDLYDGVYKLSSTLGSSGSFTWTSMDQGIYTVTAVATDAAGLTATSAPVKFTVSSGTTDFAPVCSLTSPAGGATYYAPATVSLAASASAMSGSIARVDFYNGGTLVGSATSSPYTVTLSNLILGAYSLSARAYDTAGNVAFASPVSINVGPPLDNSLAVALSSPANYAIYSPPASILLAATATDGNASIARVDFYQGNTLLGSASTSPYSYTWTNVATGTYSLTARAYDTLNVTATSAPVTARVTTSATGGPIFQINAGGGAAAPFAADACYSGGNIASTANGIDTSAVVNPAPQGVYQTERYGDFTYTIPTLSPGTTYKVRLHFSENYWSGAGERAMNVTINGAQVLTNYDIFASTGAEYKADIREFFAAPDSSGNITIQFITVLNNAKVDGIEIVQPAPMPACAITSPTNGATYVSGTSIFISATTSDVGSAILGVGFYQGGALLGTGSASPYGYTWTGVTSGTYALTAVATDAAGISATSAPVILTVSPAVSYGSWQGQYFTLAELSDGTISGDMASPAGDGIPNLLKYALNLSPWKAGASALPVAGAPSVGGTSCLSLTYTQLISAADITYIVEVSGDLQTWNSGPGYTRLVSATTNPDGVTESVTVSDLVPLGSASKRFIRLKVTKP